MVAWPIIASSLMQLMLGIADIAMVGRLGADPLAAIGFARQSIMVLISLFFGYNQSTNALVARHIGAKEPEKANKAAFQSLLFVTYLGAVITIAAFLSLDSLIALASLEDTVTQQAVSYIRIFASCLIIVLYTFILNGIFQGMGHSRVQFYVMGGANVLNIILNFFFIFGDQYYAYVPIHGLGLGVMGAAIATIISRSLASVVMMSLLASGRYPVKLKFYSLKLDWEYIRPLNVIGLPTAIQAMGRQAAMLFVFTAAARSSLGKYAIGALTVGLQTEAIAFFPVLGMMFATTAMVGQNLGAKKFDRAEQATWIAVKMAFIYMVPWALAYGLFPVQLIHIFTNDLNVVYPAAIYLIMGSVFLLTLANLPIFGALRAAGDATVPMAINLFCLLFFRVGLAYYFVYYTNIDYMGIWWAINISMAAECLLILLRFRQGVWKKIKLT